MSDLEPPVEKSGYRPEIYMNMHAKILKVTQWLAKPPTLQI